MNAETKKTWWETEFPKLEKEREKMALKHYEEKKANIEKYFALDKLKSQKQDAFFCRERFPQNSNNGFVFDTLQDYKPKKSRDDVERLKKRWLKEGVWDLWEIEGFEDYFFELRAFQFEELYRYKSELYEKQIEYTYKLETKIKDLENLLTKRQEEIKCFITGKK